MKTAVVLFNLGGPDGPEAVRPFLSNLFNDPAILRMPGLIRRVVAWLIAKRRVEEATKIYAELGGGSPILPETKAQAAALQNVLDERGEFRVFIAMRYWHPLSDEAALDVAAYGPDRICLLPLYPQFSTTTTGSSLAAWKRAARKAGINATTKALCCYSTDSGFISAQAEIVAEAVDRCKAAAGGHPPRILFSAHGLPQKIVDAGDPYQWQVERTTEAVAAEANLTDRSWVVCYQSRVGPLKWIGPETKTEIERAGAEGVPVVVVPIAFVSEHSETLVELDIEYRRIAAAAGVPAYERASTVRTHPVFIAGLADLVTTNLEASEDLQSSTGQRQCPRSSVFCAMAGN